MVEDKWGIEFRNGAWLQSLASEASGPEYTAQRFNTREDANATLNAHLWLGVAGGMVRPLVHIEHQVTGNDDLLTEVGTLAMHLFETQIPALDRLPWVELPENIKEGWRASARKRIAESGGRALCTQPGPGSPVCVQRLCPVHGSYTRAPETVNHPAHYGGDTTYETIKVIRNLGFSLGNAVKYISRAGVKDPAKHIEDLEKARWYLDEEIKALKALKAKK